MAATTTRSEQNLPRRQPTSHQPLPTSKSSSSSSTFPQGQEEDPHTDRQSFVEYVSSENEQSFPSLFDGLLRVNQTPTTDAMPFASVSTRTAPTSRRETRGVKGTGRGLLQKLGEIRQRQKGSSQIPQANEMRFSATTSRQTVASGTRSLGEKTATALRIASASNNATFTGRASSALSPSPSYFRPPGSPSFSTIVREEAEAYRTAQIWQRPVVEIFKKYAGQVLRFGDVQMKMDSLIGKRIYQISGGIPASNFVQFPRSQSNFSPYGLGLVGRYCYLQVRVRPTDLFTAHLDILTVEKQFVRITISTMYDSPQESGGAHIRIPIKLPDRWTVLAIDVPAALSSYGHRFTAMDYLCIKAVKICSKCQIRGVFTSDIRYTPETMPREMELLVRSVAKRKGKKTTDDKQMSWEDLYGWIEVPPDGAPAVPSFSSLVIHQQRNEGEGETESIVDDPEDGDDAAKSPAHGDADYMEMVTVAPTVSDKDDTSSIGSGDFSSPTKGGKSPGRQSPSNRVILPERGLDAIQEGRPKRAHRKGDDMSDGDTDSSASASSSIVLTDEDENERQQDGKPPVSAALRVLLTRRKSSQYYQRGKRVKVVSPFPALTRSHSFGLNLSGPTSMAWFKEHKHCVFAAGDAIVVMETEMNGKQGSFLPSSPSRSSSSQNTRKQMHVYGHKQRVAHIVFNSDYTLMASGEEGSYPAIKLWRVLDFSFTCVRTITHFASALQRLRFDPEGRYLLAVGSDIHRRVQIVAWDFSTLSLEGKEITLAVKQTSDFPISDIKFSPYNTRRLVSCGRENVRFWRLSAKHKHIPGTPVVLHQHARGLEFLEIAFINGDVSVPPSSANTSPLSLRSVLVATSAGTLFQIDHDTLELERIIKLHDGPIRSLCVSDGFCVSASDDKYLRIWPLDFSDFFLEALLEDKVQACEVSVDGLRVLVATSSRSLGVLDIATQKFEAFTRAHSRAVVAMACVSPSTMEFVTVSEDSTIRFWDSDRESEKFEFSMAPQRCLCISFHPKNTSQFACGFDDGFVRIFDVTQRNFLLSQHRVADLQASALSSSSFATSGTVEERAVTSVAYAHSGDFLLSSWKTVRREGLLSSTGKTGLPPGNVDAGIVVHDVGRSYQPVKLLDADLMEPEDPSLTMLPPAPPVLSSQSASLFSVTPSSSSRCAFIGSGRDHICVYAVDKWRLVARVWMRRQTNYSSAAGPSSNASAVYSSLSLSTLSSSSAPSTSSSGLRERIKKIVAHPLSHKEMIALSDTYQRLLKIDLEEGGKSGIRSVSLQTEHSMDSATITPNGKYIVTASQNGHILVWDYYKLSHRTPQIFQTHGEILSLLFVQRGKVLLVAKKEGMIEAWESMKEMSEEVKLTSKEDEEGGEDKENAEPHRTLQVSPSHQPPQQPPALSLQKRKVVAGPVVSPLRSGKRVDLEGEEEEEEQARTFRPQQQPLQSRAISDRLVSEVEEGNSEDFLPLGVSFRQCIGHSSSLLQQSFAWDPSNGYLAKVSGRFLSIHKVTVASSAGSGAEMTLDAAPLHSSLTTPTIYPHSQEISCLAKSSDGTFLATAEGQWTHVWKPNNDGAKRIASFACPWVSHICHRLLFLGPCVNLAAQSTLVSGEDRSESFLVEATIENASSTPRYGLTVFPLPRSPSLSTTRGQTREHSAGASSQSSSSLSAQAIALWCAFKVSLKPMSKESKEKSKKTQEGRAEVKHGEQRDESFFQIVTANGYNSDLTLWSYRPLLTSFAAGRSAAVSLSSSVLRVPAFDASLSSCVNFLEHIPSTFYDSKRRAERDFGLLLCGDASGWVSVVDICPTGARTDTEEAIASFPLLRLATRGQQHQEEPQIERNTKPSGLAPAKGEEEEAAVLVGKLESVCFEMEAMALFFSFPQRESNLRSSQQATRVETDTEKTKSLQTATTLKKYVISREVFISWLSTAIQDKSRAKPLIEHGEEGPEGSQSIVHNSETVLVLPERSETSAGKISVQFSSDAKVGFIECLQSAEQHRQSVSDKGAAAGLRHSLWFVSQEQDTSSSDVSYWKRIKLQEDICPARAHIKWVQIDPVSSLLFQCLEHPLKEGKNSYDLAVYSTKASQILCRKRLPLLAGKAQRESEDKPEEEPTCVCFASPVARTLLVAFTSGRLQIICTRTLSLLFNTHVTLSSSPVERISALAYLPSLSQILLGTTSGSKLSLSYKLESTPSAQPTKLEQLGEEAKEKAVGSDQSIVDIKVSLLDPSTSLWIESKGRFTVDKIISASRAPLNSAASLSVRRIDQWQTPASLARGGKTSPIAVFSEHQREIVCYVKTMETSLIVFRDTEKSQDLFSVNLPCSRPPSALASCMVAVPPTDRRRRVEESAERQSRTRANESEQVVPSLVDRYSGETSLVVGDSSGSIYFIAKDGKVVGRSKAFSSTCSHLVLRPGDMNLAVPTSQAIERPAAVKEHEFERYHRSVSQHRPNTLFAFGSAAATSIAVASESQTVDQQLRVYDIWQTV